MTSVRQISVVLPCWNVAEMLRRSIECVCEQTFGDWELIVVDDGSTDATASVAAQYASRDARVQIVRIAHSGIVGALQEGCARARGEFIARMDADDVCDPTRFEKQLALMRSDERIVLCGTQVRERKVDGPDLGRRDYVEWLNASCTHDEIVRNLFIECPLAHPTFMMRRRAYEQIGGYEDRDWAEDYDLVHRLHLAGWRFAKVPEPLLDWTDTPARLSRTNARYSAESFRACKRHYLRMGPLAGRQVFHQWGAGNAGKEWLREWGDCRPAAVVDINPRKIGNDIHGVRVIRREDLPPPGDTYVVVTVPLPEARDEIRSWLKAHGYAELRDYVFVL